MITLRPGDYVSTRGLTEQERTGVVNALLKAGCPSGEEGRYQEVSWDSIGYGRLKGGLFHCMDVDPDEFAREITMDILRPQTPCEKLGYKVGDRFEALRGNGASSISKGDYIVLNSDDGTSIPYFRNERTGNAGCLLSLDSIRPLPKKWQAPQDGLPPVGTECEYLYSEGNEWREGVCVAHFRDQAVIVDTHDYGAECCIKERVRPIRPERDRLIDTLQADADLKPKAAARVIDAGYRKP